MVPLGRLMLSRFSLQLEFLHQRLCDREENTKHSLIIFFTWMVDFGWERKKSRERLSDKDCSGVPEGIAKRDNRDDTTNVLASILSRREPKRAAKDETKR